MHKKNLNIFKMLELTILKLAFFIYIFINLFVLFLKFDSIQLSDEAFLNIRTCPFCFGQTLCNELKQNFISNKVNDFVFINQNNLFNTYFLNSLFNVKNIYPLKDNLKKKDLILKKLAHDSEFLDFDGKELDCYDKENSKRNDACLYSLITSNKKVLSDQPLAYSFLKTHSEYLGIESVSCFSQRMLNIFYNQTIYSKIVKTANNYFDQNVIILFTLKINPEPIFLQV